MEKVYEVAFSTFVLLTIILSTQNLSFWGKLTRFITALAHAFDLSPAIVMTMVIVIMT